MIKKHRLTNFTVTIFIIQFPDFSDQNFFDYLISLDIFSYFIFQRELTTDNKEHWQCYFELSSRQLFTKLQKLFRNSHLEERKESQIQAINYCKKEETRVNKYLEWGFPKVNTRTRTSLSTNNDFFLENVLKKIEKNKYSDFFAIEKEEKKDRIKFWKNQVILKNIWNHYNPLQKLHTFPSRVIWCFGPSGAGKSVWTRKYLIENGYLDEQVVFISPQNMTYNDKVYFHISDENCKVLVINEVDENFPKYNNLIAFIDRNTLLVTKGSHIRNNFSLIIINSIYRPETIFSYLGKNISSQILRRIFDFSIGSKVYEIKKNIPLLKKLENISGENFYSSYQPIVNLIKEPDYSLIPADFSKDKKS